VFLDFGCQFLLSRLCIFTNNQKRITTQNRLVKVKVNNMIQSGVHA